jgi:hypothetical protein
MNLVLKPKALSGDPLFAEMLDRVHNNPKEAVISSFKEGIESMQRNREVLYVPLGVVTGHLQVNLKA